MQKYISFLKKFYLKVSSSFIYKILEEKQH